MNVRCFWLRLLLAVAMGGGVVVVDRGRADEGDPPPDVPFWVRGVGSVFLLHPGGPLEMDLFKRDRNVYEGRTPLYGFLAAPDREILHRFVIPDDGQPLRSGLGPVQSEAWRTDDVPAGVYKLLLIVGNQRSGFDVAWSFRTNAERWVMDPGGTQGRVGSKLPILLMPGDPPGGTVWLNPVFPAFTVESPHLLGAVNSRGEPLPFDPENQRIDRSGVPADEPVGLRLSSLSGRLAVEGATFWEGPREGPDGGYYPLIGYWTNRHEQWFDMAPLRWALLPHYQAAQEEEDGVFEAVLTAHNPTDRTLEWRLRYESDHAFELLDAPDSLDVEPGEEKAVRVRFRIDGPAGAALRCRIVDPADTEVSTYVTLAAGYTDPWQPGEHGVVTMEPYRHLGTRHGYQPAYPRNEFHGHPDGRLFVRDRDVQANESRGLWVFEDGTWRLWDIRERVARAVPGFEGFWRAGAFSPTKISFDAEGRLYTAYQARIREDESEESEVVTVLVYTDGPAREEALRVKTVLDPDAGSFDIEHSVDGRPLQAPPVLAFHRSISEEISRWARQNEVRLIFPEWRDGELHLGKPVEVSRTGVGLAAHSGGGASLATRDGRTYFTWGETSDPEGDDPGVPTWVAGFDRESGRELFRRLVAYGAPKNDIHNSPALTVAPDGRLHVITGAHGRPFMHSHSTQPEDPESWSEPVAVSDRQTYLGLTVDDAGGLHAVYRANQGLPDFFDHSFSAPLVYQRFTIDEGWSDPRILIRPPLAAYSVYYHRLSRTPRGALLVSSVYRTAYRSYRSENPGILNSALVLYSPDRGVTWKVLEDEDIPNL